METTMTSQQEKLISELKTDKPNISAIEEWLQNGLIIDFCDELQNTPLHYAVLLPKAKGRNKIVQLLIDYNADIHLKGGFIKSYVGDISPCGLVIAEGNVELIQLFVANNLFPHPEEVIREFPFTKKKGSLEFLKYLLSLLVQPLTKVEMFGLLRGTIKSKQKEILLYLFTLEPDLNFTPNLSPLVHDAIYSNEIMKALLLHGANPNVFDDMTGYSLLHKAIWSTDADNVELLKTIFNFNRVAIDVNIKSKNWLIDGIDKPISGITPLAQYCRYPKDCLINSITFLLDHQADVNAIDAELGNTPLHYAFASNSFKTAALLLSKGANPSIMNLKGQTPIEKVDDPECRARVKEELCV